MLTSLGILFIKTEFLVVSLYPPSYQSHTILSTRKKKLSLGYVLSSIKFCDPLWFYFIYAFDLRCYAQMNLVLLKYCLRIVFKKRERDEKMACQRSMTPKKEREREKRWHSKEA
jgi:hypothetical protein